MRVHTKPDLAELKVGIFCKCWDFSVNAYTIVVRMGCAEQRTATRSSAYALSIQMCACTCVCICKCMRIYKCDVHMLMYVDAHDFAFARVYLCVVQCVDCSLPDCLRHACEPWERRLVFRGIEALRVPIFSVLRTTD